MQINSNPMETFKRLRAHLWALAALKGTAGVQSLYRSTTPNEHLPKSFTEISMKLMIEQ